MLLTPDRSAAVDGSATSAPTDRSVTDRVVRRPAPPGRSRLLLVPVAALATDLVLPVDWPYISTLAQPGPVVLGIAAYLALGAAALLWRGTRPAPVYAAVFGWATVAYVFLPVQPLAILLVALYSASCRLPARRAALVLAVVPVPLGLYAARQVAQPSGSSPGVVLGFSTFFYAFTAGAVWLLARQANRREGRVLELERERDERARAAVAAERRRLARELHDIVSHAVSVMVINAAGARRIIPASGPAPAADLGEVALALDAVEGQGRQAMVELRRLLGVLRAADATPFPGAPGATDSGDDDGGDDDLDGDGRPGLDDLPALIGSIATAGVHVKIVTTGVPRPLDPSIDLTAYRVVQEALTNTAKHAGVGAAALVTVRWGNDLVVEVRETGPGTVVAGADQLVTGTGLIGMRERVRALGGRLTFGPGDDGGFAVRAVLPVAAP
jgi:signal transduction histidine kinase